jgi:hypothetical protein
MDQDDVRLHVDAPLSSLAQVRSPWQWAPICWARCAVDRSVIGGIM